MSENLYPVPENFAATAHVNAEQYATMYKQSVEEPETFWAKQAEDYLDWFKKWDSVLDWSFDKDDLHIEWFKGGKLNVSHNCLDKHLEKRGDQTAILWEGVDPNEDKKITSDKAIDIAKKNKDINILIHGNESSMPIVKLSTKPIVLGKK